MSSKYHLNSSTLSQLKEAAQDHTLKPDNLYRTCMGEEVAHPLQQIPMEFPSPNPATRSGSRQTTPWEELGKASNQQDLEAPPAGACCHIYFSDLLLTKERAGLRQANKGQ